VGSSAKNGEGKGVGIAAMTITAFGQCEAQFVFEGVACSRRGNMEYTASIKSC